MAKQYIVTQQTPPWVKQAQHAASVGRWAPTPTQKHQVYGAIVAAGQDGADRTAISQKVSLSPHRVSFYLNTLKREGYITTKDAPVDVTLMSPEDAKLYALKVLEDTLVVVAKRSGITPDMDKQFAIYQKVKAVALSEVSGGQRGATDNEKRQALKLATLALVKAVF
jgi:hypothetical protein